MRATVLEWAAQHHGVVTQSEAENLGASRDLLRAMERAGVLRRAGRGVFVVAGSPSSWEQAVLVDVRRAGPSAVAAMHSAAALWGVPGYERRGRPRLIVAGHANRPGQRESYRLLDRHVTEYESIPVTTPARTVFDMHGSVHRTLAGRLADHMVNRGLCRLDDIEAVLIDLQRRGRKGTRATRWYLEERVGAGALTASELEDRVERLFAAAGIGPIERQVPIHDARGLIGIVDVLVARTVVVEADSQLWHGGWSAAVADRRRDARLLAAGYPVLRVTHWQLVNEPEAVVRATRAAATRSSAA